MGYRVDHAQTLAPAATSGIIRMTSEGGHLVSVSLHEIETTVPNIIHTEAGIFGQIWLTGIDTPTQTPLFILAQGNFGGDLSLGWTGSLLLEQSACIIFKFSGRMNSAASASIMVEK